MVTHAPHAERPRSDAELTSDEMVGSARLNGASKRMDLVNPATGEVSSLSFPADEAKLDAALLTAQQAIAPIPNDAENTHHRYPYTTAETIIEAASKALLDAGLVLTRGSWRLDPSLASALPESQAPEKSEGTRFCGMFVATMTLSHPASGGRRDYPIEYPVVTSKGRPMDKAFSAAMTTALAYALRDLLLIPRKLGDSVDDGEHGGPKRGRSTDARLGTFFIEDVERRLKAIGKSPAGLREYLNKNRGDKPELPEDMREWPASISARLEKLLDDLEVAREKESPAPKAKGPAPAERGRREVTERMEERDGEEEAPATNPDRPTRAPWTCSGKVLPSHPLFWRQKMLALAEAAIASKVSPALEGWTAETLVENAEIQWRLPTPDDATPFQAVAAYKPAHDRMAAKSFGPSEWDGLTLPF